MEFQRIFNFSYSSFLESIPRVAAYYSLSLGILMVPAAIWRFATYDEDIPFLLSGIFYLLYGFLIILSSVHLLVSLERHVLDLKKRCNRWSCFQLTCAVCLCWLYAIYGFSQHVLPEAECLIGTILTVILVCACLAVMYYVYRTETPADCVQIITDQPVTSRYGSTYDSNQFHA